MSTVGETNLTYPDLAKRMDKDDAIAKVIEILAKTNPILTDMPVMECNNGTSHITTVRTGLPASYWRLLNRGVPVSKSSTNQFEDKAGMLETWSVVDADLAELNGNKQSFMLSEETAFIEGMNQEMAKTLFYGDLKDNNASFIGLAPRYSAYNATPTTPKNTSADNVINAGGTGNNCTSIWLAQWGDQSAHGIYPKGSKAGLVRDALPKGPVDDPDRLQFMGYKTHYQWKLGLTVRDWRHIVRVANVDTASLATLISGGAATAAQQMLVRLMLDAHSRLPMQYGRAAWYMNKTAKLMLDIMAAEKSNVNLTIEMFEGKPVTSFLGVPIRQCDAILNTEAALPAA